MLAAVRVGSFRDEAPASKQEGTGKEKKKPSNDAKARKAMRQTEDKQRAEALLKRKEELKQKEAQE